MDRGLKILFDTYWNKGGWCRNFPTDEEFAQAKAEGYMFDFSTDRTHDETLSKLRRLVEKISPEDISNAFLYSLSTRELQYRSALGSYYYALAIPEHTFDKLETCFFCCYSPVDHPMRLLESFSNYNIFNFERYKWGGVRHTFPEYALFDLEQFLLLPKVTPSAEDWEILKSILHAMTELPPSKKAGAYRDLITKKKLLKSNKSEVAVLLDILGVCGILSGASAPCYFDYFPDIWHRSPQEHTNDFKYPVNRWHVFDGVNGERFRKVFGFEYSEL